VLFIYTRYTRNRKSGVEERSYLTTRAYSICGTQKVLNLINKVRAMGYNRLTIIRVNTYNSVPDVRLQNTFYFVLHKQAKQHKDDNVRH